MANKTALVAHGLSTKFFPLYLMLVVFLFVSDYTRDAVTGIDPTDFFIASVLFFGGLVFIYEGFNNKPQRNGGIGTAGFLFFFIVAGANIVFGYSIWIGEYDVLNDSGDLNLVLQILIGINMLMFLIQGIYEIIISKRLVLEKFF